MATSTLTSKGQTTVPKEVRDKLALEPGDLLSWEVRGGKIEVSTERPALFRWEGFIKSGPGNALEVIKKARQKKGRR